MTMGKFKAGQHVMIVGIYVNGDYGDTAGYVVGPGRGPSTRDNIEVIVNTVHFYFDESKLQDHDEYWKKKNAENKQ